MHDSYFKSFQDTSVYYHRNFSTNNTDLIKLAEWLKKLDCNDVCIESTGKYWIHVFNYLEDRDVSVVIAHLKYVKSPKGKD